MTFCAHQTTSPYLYTANMPHDYREITVSLVTGVDISLVSPELYDALLPYIDQYILKFQDRNDTGSINRLKFCKEYIYQYPERERIAKLLTKKKKDPPPKPLPFTQDELDSEIDKLLKLKKINSSNINYTPEEVNQILTEMRSRRLAAAEEEDFDLADRLALVSSQLSDQDCMNQLAKIKREEGEEKKQKLEEAKQAYNDLKERWENLQVKFKEETKRELSEMKENQKKEREKLEKKKSEPIPPKYRKHTQEYLNLKQEEKMLVTSKRFDDAAVTQQRVREQEKIEDQMIADEWNSIVNKELKKLDEKHKQQLKVREMNIKKEENNIKQTKRKELDALRKKVTFLENQIRDLACYGVTFPKDEAKTAKNTDEEKSVKNADEEKNTEEEKSAKNAEEEDDSYYDQYSYSYYDTEDGKSRNATEVTENTSEVFFTENNKTKYEEEEDATEVHEVHPPQDDQQSHCSSHRNRTISTNSAKNENQNSSQDEYKKVPPIKSSGYYKNGTSTLPRLKMANKARTARFNNNVPEAFRQRALLNKQIYCGKTLLSQRMRNKKDHQLPKKKKEENNSD